VEPGFRPIFNGRDLTGWVVDHGDPQAWSVHDGELRATGAKEVDRRGWLLTDRDFGDVLLRLEFLVLAGGNSGVTLRARPGESRFTATGQRHWEIQLLDDDFAGWPAPLRAVQKTGALYGIAIDEAARLKPPGQWNQLEIELRARSLRVAVNGRDTLRTDLDRHAELAERLPGLKRASGRIGLQSWEGEMRFRKIEVRPLAP
jgi:hypothetical protein